MRRAVRSLVAVVALVVGAAGPAAAAPRPFRAADLGSLSTRGVSSAVAINERDQVVGSYATIEGTLGATFFGRKTKLVFLAHGDLGPTDFAARDINERTKIVGESEFPRVPDPEGLQIPRATLWKR